MFKITYTNFKSNERLYYECYNDKDINVIRYIGQIIIETKDKSIVQNIIKILSNINYKSLNENGVYKIVFGCNYNINVEKHM